MDQGQRSNPFKRSVDEVFRSGVYAAQRGDKGRARRLFQEVTERDPSWEEAWVWRAGVSETREDASAYLGEALRLNPQNQAARQVLSRLNGGWDGDGVSSVLQALRGQSAAQEDVLDSSASLILSVGQIDAIDDFLERMARRSKVSCVLLSDTAGRLISHWGDTSSIDVGVLSALAAGELAATFELARLIGEDSHFELLLHEGEERSLYLSDVDRRVILIAVFEADTTVGLVRVNMKRAREEVKPILEQGGQKEGAEQGVMLEEALGEDFQQMLDEELESSLGWVDQAYQETEVGGQRASQGSPQ